MSFYCRMILKYADIVPPLSEPLRLQSKAKLLQWSDEANKAFEDIKLALHSSVSLFHAQDLKLFT